MSNVLTRTFADYLAPFLGGSTKHDHYKDFGFPTQLRFDDFYRMYTRNGLAKAAVKLTTQKTWETNPVIESGSASADKGLDEAIDRLGLWDKMADADDMALVGGYSGLILRYADGKRWNEPVEAVGGLDALVEVIPAWRGQLTVSEWYTDEKDADNYGKPKMWLFDESAVQVNGNNNPRSFMLHPDRVLTWSENGTVRALSLLEAGYNDLLSCEKVSGAGGEGFWKSARGAMKVTVDSDFDVDAAANKAGKTPAEYIEQLEEKMQQFDAGFDKKLFLSKMDAEIVTIDLPQPEEFHNVPLKQYAASVSIPLKILVGSQSGERASTEDANQWGKTINARRVRWVKPAIKLLIEKLVTSGVLLDLRWVIEWDDLTEATPNEKLERAERMAKVNEITTRTDGGVVFEVTEIREEAGYDDVMPDGSPTDDEMGLDDE